MCAKGYTSTLELGRYSHSYLRVFPKIKRVETKQNLFKMAFAAMSMASVINTLKYLLEMVLPGLNYFNLST